MYRIYLDLIMLVEATPRGYDPVGHEPLTALVRTDLHAASTGCARLRHGEGRRSRSTSPGNTNCPAFVGAVAPIRYRRDHGPQPRPEPRVVTTDAARAGADRTIGP